MVDWNYDTIHKIAMLLTVDKNGKDATQDGFDPTTSSSWASSRSATTSAARRLLGGRLARRRRRQDRPDPRRLEAGLEVLLRRHLEGPLHHDRPAFQSTDINPEGYPFFTGKVAMSENFLWSTYGVAGAGDDWNLAAIPSNGSKTTAAFNADTFRILKSTKHPDEAFEVLTYLLGDASQELLQLYGGFPGPDRGPAGRRRGPPGRVQEQGRLAGRDRRHHPCRHPELRGVHAGLQRDARPRRSGGKYTTKWESTQGLDMDAEFDALQKEIQAIWDKAGGG